MKPFTKVEEYALHGGKEEQELFVEKGTCSGCGNTIFGTPKHCRHCGKALVIPKNIVVTKDEVRKFLDKRYEEYGLKCGNIVLNHPCQAYLCCARCGTSYTGGNFCPNCGAKITPFGKIEGYNEKYEEISANRNFDLELEAHKNFLLDVYKSNHPSPLSPSPLDKKYTCTLEVYTKAMEDCNPSIPIVQFFTEGGMTPEQILNSSFDSDVWKHVVHGVFNGVDRMDWGSKYPTAILTPPHLEEVFNEGIADFEHLFEDEEQFAETLNRVNEMDEDNLDWIYHRQFPIECYHCGIAWEFHAYLYLKPVED